MGLKDIVQIIIQVAATALGFYVSSRHLSKKIDGEIKHSKEIKTVAKLEDVHYTILEMIRVALRNNEFMFETVEENMYFYNKIYAYGSLDSIKIIAALHKYIGDKPYQLLNRKAKMDVELKVIGYHILLATQIKYDVTGHVVNPKYWLILTGTIEYWDNKYMSDIINEVIDELKLNENFKIKDFKV